MFVEARWPLDLVHIHVVSRMRLKERGSVVGRKDVVGVDGNMLLHARASAIIKTDLRKQIDELPYRVLWRNRNFNVTSTALRSLKTALPLPRSSH
jgi:hypothetical protein